MGIGKRIVGFLAVWVTALTAAFPALADGTVIDRIGLRVEADIQVGGKCSVEDFVFTPLNAGYEIRDVRLLNTCETWGTADAPRLVLYLYADSGYTFDVTRADIQVQGAECEYGRWDDSLFVYTLQLRLPSLREQVGETAEAGWSSATAAAWSPSYNAAYYELQLYRGNDRVGTIVRSDTASYDFGRSMRREGSYTYHVRAVNLHDKGVKSSWKESDPSVIDASMAEQLRRQYAVQPGEYPGEESGGESEQTRYGWIAEGPRWWYRNPDGSYTTDNWQYIDGSWYYFDSKGYMVTGWIDWNGKSYYCDPESGAMLANTIVPDGLGRRVDSSGALIE